MTPGELVKERRLRHGLSQRRLALRAGTSQSAIARIESGKEEVTWSRLRLLLLVMGEQPVLASEPLPGRYDAWDVLEPPPAVPRAMADILDPRAMFRVLADHDVEYLVVGGFAVQTHGFIRPTVDLDIIARPDLGNLSRLGEALVSMGARVFGTAEPVNVTDPHLLRRAALVALMTDHGRLDVLNVAATSGIPADYEVLRGRATEVTLDGIELAIVGLDDLIRMKKAAGREQDRADIRALAALDEELAEEAREST
jgi:transcriptional regulator with XRE-family HTH domain